MRIHRRARAGESALRQTCADVVVRGVSATSSTTDRCAVVAR
jgi:hypothetical protein